jgi:hypothetical protein
MKTTNNAQKTENVQVKRLVVRATVILCSLIIISLTSTSAQELWKQIFSDGSFGTMVGLKVQETTEFQAADAVAKIIMDETEAKLNHSAEAISIETENEKELAIEPWMTDTCLFTSNYFTIIEEKDPEFNVESWMIDNKNFYNQNAEQKAKIESTSTTDDFIRSAEEFTNQSAPMQVERFACQQITLQSINDKARETADFIKIAELFTADGTDLEIEKYANKQIKLEEKTWISEDFMRNAEISTAMEVDY